MFEDPADPAVRDSGGLAFSAGTRMRSGLVFRVAGDLATPDDLEHLRGAGVGTIVDLRSPQEERAALSSWASGHGVRYVHLPMLSGSIAEITQTALSAPDLAAGQSLMEPLYIELVEQHGASVARTLELIAAPGAVAFGCAAGKDRTGLVAAILHVILGASLNEAVAAYVEQAPRPEQLERLARAHLGATGPAELPPGILAQLGTHPPAVIAALAYLEDTYGGVEPWLNSHQLAPGTVEALRAKLLLSASERLVHPEMCAGCSERQGAPSTRYWRSGPGAIVGEVRFHARHQGWPGLAHGGHVALVLDDAFGYLSTCLGEAIVTARMEVDYRRPAPLETPLRVTGHVVARRSRKLGYEVVLYDGEDVVAEARAVSVAVDGDEWNSRPPARPTA